MEVGPGNYSSEVGLLGCRELMAGDKESEILALAFIEK
jgi:hypothetical protein